MKRKTSRTLIKYTALALFLLGISSGVRAERVINTVEGTVVSDIINSIVIRTGEGDSKDYWGGAVYNTANGITLYGTFTGNKSISKNSEYYALGGAVYSKGNVTVRSEAGESTLFSGNYIEGTVQYADSVQNAIFMDTSDNNSRVLTLHSDGTITFNDTIDGGNVSYSAKGQFDRNSNKYSLIMEGNGDIYLNNKVFTANASLNDSNTTLYIAPSTFADSSTAFSAQAGTVSLKDGTAQTYNINKLTSNSAVKYKLDVDAANSKIDSLSVGSASSGTVTINEFNYLSSLAEGQSITFTNVLSGSNSVTLALIDSLKSQKGEILPNWEYGRDLTTSGAEVVRNNGNWDLTIYNSAVYDDNPIKVLNQKAFTQDRTYTFTGSNQTYTATSLFGTTASTSPFDIYGFSDGTSAIDADGKQLFTLNNAATDLGINGVTVYGANATSGSVAIVNSGTLRLNGSTIRNNTATASGGAILNSGHLVVENTTFSNNSVTNDGGAIYNTSGGTVDISSSTFSGNSAGRNGGALYNAGTVNITGSSFSTQSDTIFNTGTININNDDSAYQTTTSGSILGANGTININDGSELVLNDSATISQSQILKILGTLTNNSNQAVVFDNNDVWTGTVNLAKSGAGFSVGSGSQMTLATLEGVTGSL